MKKKYGHVRPSVPADELFSGGTEYEDGRFILLCKSHKERIVARLIKGMRTRGATKATI
jgi:hypothetical protein